MNPAYEHLRKLLNPPISLQIEDIVAAANQLQQEQMADERPEAAVVETSSVKPVSTPPEDSVDEVITESKPLQPVIRNTEKQREYYNALVRYAWQDASQKDWDLKYNQYIGAHGDKEKVKDLREEASEAHKITKELTKLIRSGIIKETKDERLRTAKKQFPIFQSFMNSQFDKSFAVRKRALAQAQMKKNLNNYKIEENQNIPIYEQKPQLEWELLIDETGSTFSALDPNANGKIVGVLIPSSAQLIDLAIHGTEADPTHVYESFNHLLKQKHVSIFGMDMSGVPGVSGDQWIDGISEVIGWVMRLLPLDGFTRLNVSIEQRKTHEAGSEINRLERMILQSLARVSEERANRVNLNIRFIRKYNPQMIKARKLNIKDTHKWLAFADIAAYMWGTTNKMYNQWFEDSKLLHHSLHESLSSVHRNILDRFIAGHPITGDLWNELLFSASQNPSHLVQWLNQQCLKRAHTDSKQWDLLMEHTLKHLYSKGIYMPLLSLQAKWLEEAKSKRQQRLSLREELLFDTVRLATSNHQGKVLNVHDLMAFKHKKEQLIDEDARAACLMDLHLAVQFTHFFGFHHAKTLVSEWLKHPTALIGLNLKGRVESTIGQQFAFMGDNAKAVDHFSAAIDTFERLSTPSERLGEQGHTRSYKVIAMMDSGMHTSSEIEAEMLKLTTFGTMSDLCRMLSTNNDDSLKYVHHLFLRYIYLHKRTALVEQYIDNKTQWGTGSHHPWGWINMYRALLLAENGDTEASRWFDTAIEGHRFSGIEMGIGIAFLALGLKQLQSSNEACTEENIRKLIEEYAATRSAGAKFIPCLEKVLSGEYDNPRSWLAEALPFNFH